MYFCVLCPRIAIIESVGRLTYQIGNTVNVDRKPQWKFVVCKFNFRTRSNL